MATLKSIQLIRRLYEEDGLTIREIADVMDLTRERVRQLLQETTGVLPDRHDVLWLDRTKVGTARRLWIREHADEVYEAVSRGERIASLWQP